ncbi:MAG: DUF4157 domain-containing protein [Nostoc sp.]|uniref:eCIS core domain-containing protein n=1 Tax=Nostoc sp. TaxID=1180 RepID=UPI002FF89F67
MTNKRIAQTNQQQNNQTSEASGILQRAAIRSIADAEVQSTDDLEARPLSNSALSKDFSRVAISTTKPQQIMTKLMVGPVKDKYEQEAERVAAQVVQRINAPAFVWSGEDETVQREKMETKDNEARLMRSPILQRKSSDAGMAATPNLETSINRARSGGQPMADNIRQPMEKAFSADFSRVKIHTNSQSDQLNQSIQARAFTTGQDVFFRQGAYEPGSRGGQELLAHELTHVVQQNSGELQRSLFKSSQQLSASANNLIQRDWKTDESGKIYWEGQWEKARLMSKEPEDSFDVKTYSPPKLLFWNDRKQKYEAAITNRNFKIEVKSTGDFPPKFLEELNNWQSLAQMLNLNESYHIITQIIDTLNTDDKDDQEYVILASSPAGILVGISIYNLGGTTEEAPPIPNAEDEEKNWLYVVYSAAHPLSQVPRQKRVMFLGGAGAAMNKHYDYLAALYKLPLYRHAENSISYLALVRAGYIDVYAENDHFEVPKKENV